MRLFIFITILALLVALGFYVHRRARRVFNLRRGASIAVALTLLAGPVTLLAGKLRLVEASDSAVLNLALLGSSLTLGAIFAAFFLMHVDAGRLVHRVFRRFRSAKIPDATPDPAPEPSSEPSAETNIVGRREVLVSGAALVAGPSFGTYAALLGRHDYDVNEVELRVPGWPRALDGFSIVQLSDIHIGAFVGDYELNRGVELAGAARPDLIVLTGDLLDHDANFAQRLGEWTTQLGPLARHGVAAIVGNHDYYAGIDPVLRALRRSGVKTLRNNGLVIGEPGASFALLGVDDLWAFGDAGPDLDAALAEVPSDLARVLLCHQPEFFYENAGNVQLQLSGHTHGGQVSLGYNPASLVMPHGYVRGHYEKDGGQLYVNRGFGTAGPPARLGSQPEITKLILTG
jgi:predicted MPP superfamily phosphohydrolase